MKHSEPSLRGGSPWLFILESTCSQVLQAWPQPSITFSLEECPLWIFLSADSVVVRPYTQTEGAFSLPGIASWCLCMTPWWSACQRGLGALQGGLELAGTCGCGWPFPSCPNRSSLGKALVLNPYLGPPPVSWHWHSAALSLPSFLGVGGDNLLGRGWRLLAHRRLHGSVAWKKHLTPDLSLCTAPVHSLVFLRDNAPSCYWLTVKMNSVHRWKDAASQKEIVVIVSHLHRSLLKRELVFHDVVLPSMSVWLMSMRNI